MMILPDTRDALHKAWLYRVLEAVADHPVLSQSLYFKGGTCASMLGWLDRFSVDLDFDYAGGTSTEELGETRAHLEKLFSELGLSVKDQSAHGLQYFLKYETAETPLHTRPARNTLKIDAAFPLYAANVYKPQRLQEIDRVLMCQSRETMFSHKLMAVLDRFAKTGQIAGRDIYDIHHFFLQGYTYDPAVIRERSGMESQEFLKKLYDFIDTHVTDTVIREDLSALLPPQSFARIHNILKRETLGLIRDEERRVTLR